LKRVAVSQGVVDLPDRGERCDALDQRLSALISAAGYAPVPVPNSLSWAEDGAQRDPVNVWMGGVGATAVLLSGGADIGALPERDRAEERLLAFARANRLPVLGICRGMQMMAVWSGAGLGPVRGHVRVRHRLQGELGGEANSFHNLALTACPPGFRVTARSEDGSIEAIRNDSLSWEGWMWHPEREERFCARDLERLAMLFGP
jgi:GMP synthase-like glutamine amidotransferase